MSHNEEGRRPSRTDRRSGFGTVLLISFVLALPLLYTAGIGPANWLVRRGYVSQGAVETIFAPVNWLYLHTPLQGPLGWYAGLWAD